METMAREIAKGGIHVVRFNFPYMEKRLVDGRKRPPDRAPVLLDAYREVVNDFQSDAPIFIGGKSMGGRMASLVVEQTKVSGLICLGFPFHPPGKPENYKGDHLKSISTPSLIIQGEQILCKRESSKTLVCLRQSRHSLLPMVITALSREKAQV